LCHLEGAPVEMCSQGLGIYTIYVCRSEKKGLRVPTKLRQGLNVTMAILSKYRSS